MTDICVVDLGFGDAGKGTTVDYLARENPDATVVRFNGGAQAAHNVITPYGEHHTFAQFGSGTLAGNRTHLSRFMLVNPMNMLREAHALATKARQWDAFDRLTIDPTALVTTPFHVAWNRITEILRGGQAHGSCGQGIGATVEYAQEHVALRVQDLADLGITQTVLSDMQTFYKRLVDERLGGLPALSLTNDQRARLQHAHGTIRGVVDVKQMAQDYKFWYQIINIESDYNLTGDLIFEGAQGIGLDETYGTAPHNTWSDCTPRNAALIAGGLGRARPRTIGVTRTYTTRHGAGPLPTETDQLDHQEPHNTTGTYQGAWRIGHLDCGLLNYSIAVCDHIGYPVDEIAVTHMDRLDDTNRVGLHPTLPSPATLNNDLLDLIHRSRNYEDWTRDDFVPELERAIDVPITILSYGPTADDKKVRCDSTL